MLSSKIISIFFPHDHHHWHLGKCQRPEAEDSEKEDVEGPEEDDEGVEVVLEAGQEERLDCLPYVQGRGNCTVIMFLLIVVCVAVHRVGPQTQKLPSLEITLDPTWSVHKIARGKKFHPKKIVFNKGDCIFICTFYKGLKDEHFFRTTKNDTSVGQIKIRRHF